MMDCSICGGEGVGTCKSCGQTFCSGQGNDYCQSCAVAIVAAEASPRRVRTGFLQCVNRPRMKTIHIDDDGPPSCHLCGGLARQLCAHCQQLYCPEHAGRKGWCTECTRSTRVGLFISVGILAFVGVLTLLMFLLSSFQKR